jgi:uncharacterized oxidoreductase
MDVIIDTDAYALIDGNWGWGQVMGRQAVELGVRKARHSGVVTVAGRNCCHLVYRFTKT